MRHSRSIAASKVGTRKRRSCSAVTAIMLLFFVPVAVGNEAASATSDTTCVGDVGLIRVRGSGDRRASDADLNRVGQEGNSGSQLTLDAVSKQFRRRMAASGRTVNEYDLEYPANSVPPAAWGSVNDIGPYIDSINQGKSALTAALSPKRACSQPLILLGYSQGALVVGDVLAGLSDADASRVAGVGLFGDPRFDPADPTAAGSFDPKRFGIAGTVYGKRQLGARFIGRGRNYCYSEDLVCQGHNLYQSLDVEENAHARGYACNGLTSDADCRRYLETGGASMAKSAGDFIADTALAKALVGQGAADPSGWRSAWSTQIGQAINAVHEWGGGCIQDFRGGTLGDSALMQRNCAGAVYPVTGAHWRRVAAIGPTTIGYPTNASHRWGATWTQDFDGGTWSWNAILIPDLTPNSGFVVRTGFWSQYRQDGGPAGKWGVPRNDEYATLAGAHQDFTGGTMIARIYGDRLNAGQNLTTGDKRVSADERFQIVNQGDGNIVVYGPSGAAWSTGTAGRGQLRFVMQGDGNLVAYDTANRALWSSDTSGYPGSYSIMQSDGNFVVYDPTNYPLWSIFTGRINRPDPSVTGLRALANNLFVSAELNYAGGAYGMLRARAGGIGGWEQFKLVGDCRSGGGCAIQSVATGLYVSAELGYSGAWYGVMRARASGIGSWERFRLVGDCWSTNGCTIQSVATGLFVTSELNYTGAEIGMLRAARSNALGWEKFSFR
jgi:Cutinase